MADEGFHEIQLNGKQLVFMFMAATVMAVVIFLLGVMAGRSMRAPRPSEALEASVTEGAVDPTVSDTRAVPAAPATTTDGAPPASQETLTYPERLEETTPPPETLGEPSPESPPSRAPAAKAERPAARAPEPPRVQNDAPSTEPPGNGFVVQVAAVRERNEADTIARRLATKGYPSFVTTPGAGTPRVFRVRVGKYAQRREAETVATRLQKEEQFKPWITR